MNKIRFGKFPFISDAISSETESVVKKAKAYQAPNTG